MGEGGRYEILNRVQDMRIHIIKVPPHPPLRKEGIERLKGKGIAFSPFVKGNDSDKSEELVGHD